MTRRSFFERAVDGLQGAALVSVLGRDLYGAAVESAEGPRTVYDLKPRAPHFEPKAKSVIHLFMNGGPSQMDLFDPKPMLEKHHGEPYFDKIASDVASPKARAASCAARSSSRSTDSLAPGFRSPAASDRGSGRHRHDQSMYTMHPNHEPALFMIQSGASFRDRPAMGSWVVYGLGTENQNLPAYVVLDDPLGLPINGPQTGRRVFCLPFTRAPGSAPMVRPS